MRGKYGQARIRNILCPSDLSPKSQKALGFAARFAEMLSAQLTACYCAPAAWFTSDYHLPKEKAAEIRAILEDGITKCQNPNSELKWRSLIIENSFDPAKEILNLARETAVDLIVIKARPWVLSAFRFSSIVERVVSGATCPVLLMPSRFLAKRDPATSPLEFHRVLFDYDFSDATDELFHVANALTRDCKSHLHVLSILETPALTSSEVALVGRSRTTMQTAVYGKLNEALQAEGRSVIEVPTAVEWGNHADTILRYAKDHDIDLICTTLPSPHFYFEKLYSVYLGDLLRSVQCPVLVKQAIQDYHCGANYRF